MIADYLIKNVNLATMQEKMNYPYGAIENGLLAIHQNKICWVGEQNNSPAFENAEVFDAQGAWLTPGLIDCHTHLVYAGNRAKEFEWSLQGKSYQEIAKQGGGIMNTVNATRLASEESLLTQSAVRLKRLLEEGVTTVEIKSGYGLDLNNEIKMLHVARQLEKQFPVTVRTTFLGAHALPPEYKNKDDYIHFICSEVLPEIAQLKLADAVDVFCEDIAFSPAQCRKIFETAQTLGLPVKGHVEQLSYLAGANLVAEFSGLSVDHLEYLPESDVLNLKQKDIVGVLLPAAYYFLHESQLPPIKAMRQASLAMAVASDCNPGSAPVASLLTAMNFACVLFGLTPEESLTGVTRNAAQALGLESQKGQLAVGLDADLALWDIEHPAELSNVINMHRPTHIWVAGKHV